MLFRSLQLSAVLLAIAPTTGWSATVWDGPDVTFTKPGGADYLLAENQDALTANVVLTRPDQKGLINIVAESSFANFSSPADTLWATPFNNASATIDAANYQSLLFDDWQTAYGSGGIGNVIVGVDAVVHLVTDDIYFNLRVTSWGIESAGAGVSYVRSTAPSVVGDYDGSGTVDTADYLAWRSAFGDTGASPADGNGDNLVDAADYTLWRDAYAASSAAANSSALAIPEPAAGLLLYAGCSCLLVGGSCFRARQSRTDSRHRG